MQVLWYLLSPAAALYVEEAEESVGLIGVHQLIRLDVFVPIQYSHEGQAPGFGRDSGHVSPGGISYSSGRCPFIVEHDCDTFAVILCTGTR